MSKTGDFLNRKKAIVSEYLPWLLIALAVLAILVISMIVLKDKGISVIDQIKGMLFGR
ncbi:hypothetical protein J4474_00150 [Candidatus Pacearchaeota archaeon]|nr:hypothetical protein [Candidatus Pacearchaeota archaeon]